MEGEGPSIPVCQAGWGVPGDHEDDPHGVDGPPGGGHLCHLHGTDAKRPHINLPCSSLLKGDQNVKWAVKPCS